MSNGQAGQNAADSVRDAVKGIGNASEDLRKNINSFSDDLLGGNKQHGGSGVHPDAKKTGDEMAKGAGAATGKAEAFVEKHKK